MLIIKLKPEEIAVIGDSTVKNLGPYTVKIGVGGEDTVTRLSEVNDRLVNALMDIVLPTGAILTGEARGKAAVEALRYAGAYD